MLIDVPFKDNDLVSFKLSNGDEIIARFQGESNTGYKINRPMILQLTQQGMALVPYFLTVADDANVELLKNSLVFVHKTRSELEPAYIQATTGISTINTNKILR